MTEELKKNNETKETEEQRDDRISIGSAVMGMILAFGVGLIIGGYFLPLGEKGKGAGKGSAAPAARKADTGDVAKAKRLKMKVPADAPYIGPKDAPVTILAFDDFQCPFCRRFADALHKAMEKYPKEVKFVFVNFPLRRIHPMAQLAAEVGMEAMAQGKFREMHDKLFANQRQINRDNVLKWAKEIGMDVEKLKQALDSGKWKKAIDNHLNLGRRVGVRGTPTILINGRWFRSYNANDLIREIQKELDYIKKRNIPAAKAWDILTANGVRTIPELRGQKQNKNDRNRRRRRTIDPNVAYKITFTDKDPWKGTKDALVTIVEFSDYQCPFCYRVEATLDKLLEKYKGKVKLVYLQNPLFFHTSSRALSNAALEVLAEKGMDAYWKYHKLLFQHRNELRGPSLRAPEEQKQAAMNKIYQKIAELAKQVGADPKQVMEAAKTDKHKDIIARHQALARKFGATGTPSFFINGRPLRGAQPIQNFERLIDEELKKAEAAIKAGKATAANYYDYIMKSASPVPKYIGGDAPRPPRPRLDTSKRYRIWPIDKLPYYGDPNAKVVIAGAFDLQCPFCARLAPTIIKLMKGDPNAKKDDPNAWHGYGTKGGVKFVFLHFPLSFHRLSQTAHEALQEVFEQKGPEAFFKYMEIIYKNYRTPTRENLEKWAKELGVNMPRFKEALDTHKHAQFIKQMEKMAAQIGVRGTPTVYVNGKQVMGRTLEIYRSAIDSALKEADAFLKAHPNVKPDKYYETIMLTAEPKAVWITPGQQNKPKIQVKLNKLPKPQEIKAKLAQPPMGGVPTKAAPGAKKLAPMPAPKGLKLNKPAPAMK